MPPLNTFQKSCIALAVGQALVPSNLQAATITVDAPGTPSACTLYNAFASANTDAAVGNCDSGAFGADSIVLPANTTFLLDNTVYATSQGLLASSEITVQGNNSIIKRDTNTSFDKRLIFAYRATLTLNDIALAEGQLTSATEGMYGAAIYSYSSTLTLNNSSLSNNSVNGSGGAILAVDSDITLNSAHLRRNSASQYGGGILAFNSDLSINQSALNNNTAAYGGGAILQFDPKYEASLSLTISDSQLSNNSGGKYGGAILARNSALFSIQNTRLENNRTGGVAGLGAPNEGQGGAVLAYNSPLSISQSSLSQNSAGAAGGAIALKGSATVSIDQSSLHRNLVPSANSENAATAYNGGGAIFFAPTLDLTYSHSITNSTLSSNYGPYGAAILAGSGNLTITNSTIVGSGGEGGGEFGGEFGGFNENLEGNAITAYNSAGTTLLNLSNSVISHAVGGEFSFVRRTSLCQLEAGASLGLNNSNFFQDSSCTGGGEDNASPRLAERTSYFPGGYSTTLVGGGNARTFVRPPEQTFYIPLFDSPLLGGGEATVCSAAPVNSVDQRQIAHADPACDIGAIDARNTVITVDNVGDGLGDAVAACTLRDALLSAQDGVGGGEGGEGGPMPAKSSGPGGYNKGSGFAKSGISANAFAQSKRSGSTCATSYDLATINFDATVFPSNATTTILEDSSQYSFPAIISPVIINGPGANALIVDAGGEGLMSAYSANLYMNNLTLSNGYSYRGGALSISNSVVSLDDMVISGNSAKYRGGAISTYGSEVSINRSTISGNSAGIGNPYFGPRGGGIYAGGEGVVIVNASTISGNTLVQSGSGRNGSKRGGGAAIRNGAFMVLINSTISGNGAEYGGGVSATSNSYLISYHSTFSNNYANIGGGVYLGDNYSSDSYMRATNSLFSGNLSALNSGAEMYVNQYGTAQINSSLIGESSKDFFQAVAAFDPLDVNLDINTKLATSTDATGGENPGSTPLASILGLLKSNGGPTFTHNLVNNSPAIDGGEGFICVDNFLGAGGVDQRGRRRNDGSCDIGSVEFDNSSFYTIRAKNGAVFTIAL